MSLFLLNRSPEPGEVGVPVDEHVFLEVVDDGGADVDLTALQVWIASEGGPEVLAFDAGVFQPGFAGSASYTASGGLGIRRVQVDLQSLLQSLEEVTVHVTATNDAGIPEMLDQSYSFFVEDLTPPVLVSAEALGLQLIRVTFDEPVVQADAAATGDALNPANYALARLTAPSVDVIVTSVETVTPTVLDLTTDIPLSPGRRYRLTSSGVEDLIGNAVAPPFDHVEFVAYSPPRPADREFVLIDLLAQVNRDEDVTEDLAKFTACLQEVTDLVLYDIDRWADSLLDPDTAEEQYLDAMLADLGNPFPFVASSSAVDKRRLIRVLVDIYRLKGTEKGVVDTVRFFLGLEVDVDEFIDGAVMLLGESELGSDGTDGEWVLGASAQATLYSFVVVSPVTLTDDQKDKIGQIVEFIKPGHTHFLGFVEPTAPIVIDHLELGLSELGLNWELH